MKEQVPAHTLPLRGRYIVEVWDERERKVVDMVKSNYITPLWANYAKWLQSMWPSFTHRMVHNSQVQAGDSVWNGVGQPFINRGVNPFWPRPFPYQCIVLTDDTAAENTAEHWMKGNVTAWASMWKSSNIPASGRRGQINEAECVVNGDGTVQKKVWDWSTQQGNGTYQTAGIGMIGLPNTQDVLQTMAGPHAIVCPPLTELQAAIAAGPLGNSTNMNNISDIAINNGKVFAMVYGPGSGTNANEKRTLVADVPGALNTTDLDGSGLLYDLSGLSWTDLTPSFTNWTNTNSPGAAHHYSWPREYCYVPADNDLLWAETFYTQTHRFGRNDLATKAAVWVRQWNDAAWGTRANPQANGDVFPGICKVGTHVFIANPSTTVATGTEVYRNNLYRVDYADGLNLTLIPLPAGYYLDGGCVQTDGTDLFIWTNRGICRITTAGVITENYGYPHDMMGAVGENGLSPWPTAATGSDQQLFKGRQHGGMYPFGQTTRLWRNDTYSNTQLINQFRHIWTTHDDSQAVESANAKHLRIWNGKLWLKSRQAYERAMGRVIMPGVTGANAFSRALLDAPVTKSASQTMKVSYELTLPDMDTWVHDHPIV